LAVLKREALMFDTICVPTLKESFFSSNHLHKHERHVLDELEWLLERQIVSEAPKQPANGDTMADDVENFISAMIRSKFDRDESQLQMIRPIENGIRVFGDLAARYHTIKLREHGLTEVFPVLDFGLRNKKEELKS